MGTSTTVYNAQHLKLFIKSVIKQSQIQNIYNMRFSGNQPAYLTKLLKMNQLPTETYRVKKKVKPMVLPPTPNPKLNFGIETILAMKCSTQRRKEMMEKRRNSHLLKTEEPKCTRKRKSFSIHQIEVLESVFRMSKYIACEKRLDLAHELDLEIKQIKNWFQNRRVRECKDRKFVTSDGYAESE